MAVSLKHDIGAIARQFRIRGEFLSAEPHGRGHINDTYRAVFSQAGVAVRYILQRINHKVFRNPAALMENVQRVTAHLAAKVHGREDSARRALTLFPTRSGQAWHVDADGSHWRAYRFIEQAHACDAARSADQAFKVAQVFGQFQTQLADLPAPRLHDTIPDFHHTPKRFAALEQTIASDAAGRAVLAKPEIEFALAHKPMAGVLLDADLPERIAHNDAKFNNVLLDDTTGEGICVIDLDTVMPGLALHDFGDLVRTATSPVEEDERDLSRVQMQFSMFEALVRGYLSTAGEFLTEAEKRYLTFSGKLITFETGIRFLTDFLAGDVYFKVDRDGQNLDRCRTQFKLVESIEQQEERMNRVVEGIQ